MKLCLKYSKHKQKYVEVEKNETFLDVQNKLKDIDHDILQLESIIFVFNGKRISDEDLDKTLEELNIVEDSMVAVFVNNKKNKDKGTPGSITPNITSILDTIQQTLVHININRRRLPLFCFFFLIFECFWTSKMIFKSTKKRKKVSQKVNA